VLVKPFVPEEATQVGFVRTSARRLVGVANYLGSPLARVSHAPRFQSVATALALDPVVPVETMQNTMKYRAKKKGSHDDEDKPCVKRVDPGK
jgi:hypothetical protein